MGARTLELPVPYPPPNVAREGYTWTPSHHHSNVFGRRGTDHLPELG